MQMNSRGKDEFPEQHSLGMQPAYYIQSPLHPAIADLHLQLPFHTWECAGFVDSISGMLAQPTCFPE